MKETALLITALVGAALFWLLPLYFVCQWAKNRKRNYTIVGIVGILTGWLIALLVAALLPELSDEKMAQLGAKHSRTSRGEGEPMDNTDLFLCGIGVLSVIMLCFIAWMKFVL